MAWNPDVLRVQEALRSFNLYPGALDGIAGPQTAAGVLEAWGKRLDILAPDSPLMVAFRKAIASTMPTQHEVEHEVGAHLGPHPHDPRCGKWNDDGAYARAHYGWFTFPVCGRLYMHRDAAWRWMLALGEVEYRFPFLSLGKACSFCLRHRNWDPAQGWSMHCYGAIDFDLNQNGKWERVEVNLPVDTIAALAVLRSWGMRLGLDWHGASEDDMHIEATCG